MAATTADVVRRLSFAAGEVDSTMHALSPIQRVERLLEEIQKELQKSIVEKEISAPSSETVDVGNLHDEFKSLQSEYLSVVQCNRILKRLAESKTEDILPSDDEVTIIHDSAQENRTKILKERQNIDELRQQWKILTISVAQCHEAVKRAMTELSGRIRQYEINEQRLRDTTNQQTSEKDTSSEQPSSASKKADRLSVLQTQLDAQVTEMQELMEKQRHLGQKTKELQSAKEELFQQREMAANDMNILEEIMAEHANENDPANMSANSRTMAAKADKLMEMKKWYTQAIALHKQMAGFEVVDHSPERIVLSFPTIAGMETPVTLFINLDESSGQMSGIQVQIGGTEDLPLCLRDLATYAITHQDLATLVQSLSHRLSAQAALEKEVEQCKTQWPHIQFHWSSQSPVLTLTMHSLVVSIARSFDYLPPMFLTKQKIHKMDYVCGWTKPEVDGIRDTVSKWDKMALTAFIGKLDALVVEAKSSQ